ncbi:MAG: hypothetical protein ACMG6E_08110 [Candidatus Roizmanbacteria bacterium]
MKFSYLRDCKYDNDEQKQVKVVSFEVRKGLRHQVVFPGVGVSVKAAITKVEKYLSKSLLEEYYLNLVKDTPKGDYPEDHWTALDYWLIRGDVLGPFTHLTGIELSKEGLLTLTCEPRLNYEA